MALEPFRTAPRFLDKAWGDGARMRARFGLAAPPRTGEAWLVSDVGEAPSAVLDGPFAGRTLRDVVREAPAALLGALAGRAADFPLLVKLLEVAAPISVQVHPDGPTAEALGDGARGKAEAWLVLDAGPAAAIDLGLREAVAPAEVIALARAGALERLLDRRRPVPGASYEILPGTLHSALDVLALEVQESADVTYRVYDWGRDRPLHLDQARAALERTSGHHRRPHVVEPAADPARAPRRTALASGGAPFRFETLELPAGARAPLDPAAGPPLPGVAVVLEGRVTLVTAGGARLALGPGEAAVLPAEGRAGLAVEAGPAPARLAHAAPRLV